MAPKYSNLAQNETYNLRRRSRRSKWHRDGPLEASELATPTPEASPKKVAHHFIRKLPVASHFRKLPPGGFCDDEHRNPQLSPSPARCVPSPQHCASAVWRSNGAVAVLLGDALHSLPPDIGQGAGLLGTDRSHIRGARKRKRKAKGARARLQGQSLTFQGIPVPQVASPYFRSAW